MKPCLIEGCDKPAGVPGTAKGLCSMHYTRLRRTGDPLMTFTALKPKASEFCSVDGCGKKRWAGGLCPMHRQRLRATGDVGSAEPQAKPRMGICRITNCQRPVRYGIHQLCQGHYLRQMRHGDALAGARSPQADAACSIATCDRKHYAKDLCRAHWAAIARRRRKKLILSAEGRCTAQQLAARFAYYAGRCHVCKGHGDEVDHVKPLAAGGCNWPANLRPICARCNRSKGATWRDVFGHHTPITTKGGLTHANS